MATIADEERYKTVPQILADLPGSAGAPRPAPSTVTRWILKGMPLHLRVR